MGFADIPIQHLGGGSPTPPKKIKSTATSTSGAVFGWVVVLFITILLAMVLVKIGMVWFA